MTAIIGMVVLVLLALTATFWKMQYNRQQLSNKSYDSTVKLDWHNGVYKSATAKSGTVKWNEYRSHAESYGCLAGSCFILTIIFGMFFLGSLANDVSPPPRGKVSPAPTKAPGKEKDDYYIRTYDSHPASRTKWVP